MKAGIIGTGASAAKACRALQHMHVDLMGVWASDSEQGTSFAKKNGIAHVYEDCDELLAARPDLVYIGVANDQHYAFTKKALEAGIATVTDMPFAGTYERTQELNDLAEENDVFLFEAVTMRTSSVYSKILTALDEVGELRMIRTNAGHIGSDVEMSSAHSGGALYNVIAADAHFVIDLFGRPKYSLYMANKERTGIDTSGVLLMDEGPFKAVCTGSLESVSEHVIEMIGTEGTLVVTFAEKLAVTLQRPNGSIQLLCEDIQDPMYEMFHEVITKLEAGDRSMARVWMNRTMQTMYVLDQSRTDAGIDFDEDIKEDRQDMMAMMLAEMKKNLQE